MAATPAAVAREELERVEAPLVAGAPSDEALSESTLQCRQSA